MTISLSRAQTSLGAFSRTLLGRFPKVERLLETSRYIYIYIYTREERNADIDTLTVCGGQARLEPAVVARLRAERRADYDAALAECWAERWGADDDLSDVDLDDDDEEEADDDHGGVDGALPPRTTPPEILASSSGSRSRQHFNETANAEQDEDEDDDAHAIYAPTVLCVVWRRRGLCRCRRTDILSLSLSHDAETTRVSGSPTLFRLNRSSAWFDLRLFSKTRTIDRV